MLGSQHRSKLANTLAAGAKHGGDLCDAYEVMSHE
jgi:hypothetical protein